MPNPTYRFCVVCRGGDKPFITCRNCKQPYHYECSGSNDIFKRDSGNKTTTRNDWVCNVCLDNSDEEIVEKSPEELAQDRAVKQKFQLSKCTRTPAEGNKQKTY